MAGTAKQFRHAASVILVASARTKERAWSSLIRTMVAQRSYESRFMPGSYVFPGGVVEEKVDFDPFWAQSYRSVLKLSSSPADRQRWKDVMQFRPTPIPAAFLRYGDDSAIPPSWAFKVCALRELFEECGILLVYDRVEEKCKVFTPYVDQDCPVSGNKLASQKDMLNDPQLFLKLFEGSDRYSLAFWYLNEWANWLTPAFYEDSKRFDTLFYVVTVPNECPYSLPQKLARPEMETVKWVDPVALLRDAYDGDVNTPPPQIYELSRLASFSDADALSRFAAERASKYGLVRNCPQIGLTSDHVRLAVLPGDSLYKLGTELVPAEYMKHEEFLTSTAEQLLNESECVNRSEFLAFENKAKVPWTNWTLRTRNFDDPAHHATPISSPFETK